MLPPLPSPLLPSLEPPQAAIPSVAASAIPAIPSRAPVRRRRFFF